MNVALAAAVVGVPVSFFGGFLAGAFLCKRGGERMPRLVVPSWRPNPQTIVIWAMVLAIVASCFSLVFQVVDDRNDDRCMAIRDRLAQRDRDATAKVFITALTAKNSTDVRAALEDYVKEREAIAADLAEHPLSECSDDVQPQNQGLPPLPDVVLPDVDADKGDEGKANGDTRPPSSAPDVRPMAATTGTGGRGSEERRPRSRQPDGRDDPDPRPPSGGGNGGGDTPPGSPVDELFGTADEALDMTDRSISRVANVIEDELPEPGNDDCEEDD
jgi:hypothetical protein